VFPSPPVRAELELPGDKSISHRAFLLNTLGRGEARIQGANPGADVASTRGALRALGVSIQRHADGSYRIRGREGKLRPANDRIDCGNSGTTMRLLCGLLAAQPFTTTLDGDTSLRRRPMQRIAEPLRRMGARVEGPDHGASPPLIVSGGELRALPTPIDVASAQVKSCLLLAAVAAGCALQLRESPPTRDHTERMLRSMGALIDADAELLRLGRSASLRCVDVDVPGDPSAAALLAAAALAIPKSEIAFAQLLLNPRRTGFVAVLQRMGFAVQTQIQRQSGGEPVGSLALGPCGTPQAVAVAAAEIPDLIDELPALVVLSAFAEQGESRFEGLAELRVKESDRVAALANLLAQAGVRAQSDGDRLLVGGGTQVEAEVLRAADDHRIAMAAVALACGIAVRRQHAVRVDGIAAAAISHPDFLSVLARSGVRLAA
jgi:3-phosphoshikimate 1-carboxyvinyltransferase